MSLAARWGRSGRPRLRSPEAPCEPSCEVGQVREAKAEEGQGGLLALSATGRKTAPQGEANADGHLSKSLMVVSVLRNLS